ncbi:FIST C-terminal domain-containing protein [Hahella sp. CR1]|uniref:FIST signal transduction protein n=1 Tax=Hahella sp. CR1 TaxID=2992807 RepID=UPI00244332B8|nr:FIST N-terminal domain-containing protein [Hahella sp. CR1]MDG9669104.1 FIST C-terminal domain-containing protein [Hahella sp. CR1]
MKACSTSTNAADPYRAGTMMGDVLAAISPEVIFLFSTVHYENPQELVEGLYDSIGNDDLVIIGSTGDGFFESEGPRDIGACALALNSEGLVRWRASHALGVGEQPAQTARTALSDALQACGDDKPTCMFMVSDFRADASQIEKVLEFETDIPIVGGFAADDNKMASCTLYANRRALSDAVVVMTASGELHFDISIGNTLNAVGQPGVIDKAEGATIFSIDGTDAMDFIERETGKPVLQSDRGITSLSIIDSDEPDITRLRSIVPDFSVSERFLGLYGGIEQGKTVQVCLAQPETIISEVYSIAEKARKRGVKPVAALIVSCVGRKWLLGHEIEHEIRALAEHFGSALPIAGFPSFGEIGPLKTAKGYSRNLFHNMTYVLLLISE